MIVIFVGVGLVVVFIYFVSINENWWTLFVIVMIVVVVMVFGGFVGFVFWCFMKSCCGRWNWWYCDGVIDF